MRWLIALRFIWMQVKNRGGADLLVFPPASTQIENYGLNVAVVIPAGGAATFTFDGVDKWWQTQ